jgi:hypothetical protein
LLAHKDALFSHLTQRWRDLFNVDFDVLLYDLTSTYFEVNAADLPEGTKRRHGYSRDKRPDCPQLVIALVVTPEGLPLAYEVLPGNTADSKTLRLFLSKIETQYGKARRVWVMDRGVPTEAVLARMLRRPVRDGMCVSIDMSADGDDVECERCSMALIPDHRPEPRTAPLSTLDPGFANSQRVVEMDEIGEIARRDAAQVVAPPEESRGNARGHPQRVGEVDA